jgi:Carboxypeptidase regulatory-like domain/TonB-dependent Receptor Plug Domain
MSRSHSVKWMLSPAVLISFLILPNGLAQETTAGVQGMVKDSSNASISGATVEVAGPSLIGTRKVTTDEGGNYRITQLPAGVYTVTVSAKGFRTDKLSGIELAVGRLPTIDVRLQVGTVSETVEVSSIAPIVDTTQSKVQATVSRELLSSLPEGRSFQSVIPFAAGARQEPLQGGANGFQIDGASNGENVYLIDGVNTTNIQSGGVGKSFQMDFVEEVQIKSSSFEAEYGGALGGVINAVGKRGSNDWHGTLVTYLQSNGLNNNNGDRGLRINPTLPARNTTTRLDGTPEYFSAVKDHQTIVEPGYTVGGALLKDKLWIFSSYIPSLTTTRRLTNFTGLNPGPRTLTQTATQHNAYNRLDYGVTNNLRVRFVELRLLAHHRSLGRPGEQLRPAQYRLHHRSEHPPFGCGLSQSAGGLQFRWRLDADCETGCQRTLRLLLQQQ